MDMQYSNLGNLQKLEDFFENLHSYLPSRAKSVSLITPKPEYQYLAGTESLSNWIASLRAPLIAARRGGFLCDPWAVAGLKRDEVRNSRVLAWLLDPRESHGFGDVFLKTVTQKIFPDMPVTGDRYDYSVRTESSPDGDGANRLDIEIEAPNCYLVIEVKIDAVEGERQLARYAEICAARARGKPWKIIFLTPKGKNAGTAGDAFNRVVPLAWSDLSGMLERSLEKPDAVSAKARSREMFTYHLVEWFLKHIRKF